MFQMLPILLTLCSKVSTNQISKLRSFENHYVLRIICVFKSLLTTPSNVLPLQKAVAIRSRYSNVDNTTEGYKIKSALPFKIFSTLSNTYFFTLVLYSMIIRHLREVSSDKRTVTNVSTSYTRKTQLVFSMWVCNVFPKSTMKHYPFKTVANSLKVVSVCSCPGWWAGR